jgi:hypothetical protein
LRSVTRKFQPISPYPESLTGVFGFVGVGWPRGCPISHCSATASHSPPPTIMVRSSQVGKPSPTPFFSPYAFHFIRKGRHPRLSTRQGSVVPIPAYGHVLSTAVRKFLHERPTSRDTRGQRRATWFLDRELFNAILVLGHLLRECTLGEWGAHAHCARLPLLG